MPKAQELQDIKRSLLGSRVVWFVNGKRTPLTTIKQVIFDDNGNPSVLITDKNVSYNFRNILSVNQDLQYPY